MTAMRVRCYKALHLSSFPAFFIVFKQILVSFAVCQRTLVIPQVVIFNLVYVSRRVEHMEQV